METTTDTDQAPDTGEAPGAVRASAAIDTAWEPTAAGTVRLVASGFAMGSADLVPGVSGGTVALVVRIYDRLVGNVRHGAKALGRLARGDLRGFWTGLLGVEWSFLLPLVAVTLLIVMNRSDLLGRYQNGAVGNVLGGIVVLVALFLGGRTLFSVYTTLFGGGG